MSNGVELNPHAFHRNLPKHHVDDDGIPYITKFAQQKARQIVKLALSIELKESLYVPEDDLDNMKEDADDEDFDDDDDDHALPTDYNLSSVTKKISRLQSQLSTLESFKHSGISQLELCNLVLLFLRLLTATVSFDYSGGGEPKANLHYENVGYVYQGTLQGEDETKDSERTQTELKHRFALPSPARESLLSILISIMSKKSLLRSASNAAIFAESGEGRIALIIHWRVLLRTLLRTAPYLDENEWADPPKDSNSRQNTILKRTVLFIRHARHFFDQGILMNQERIDAAAHDIWNMAKGDLVHSKHTHAFYRALIMLYLFQPTRCSTDFYLEVMPVWFECWTDLDRSPEIDFLWLTLFCRARKHMSPHQFDWGPLRRRLLTHSQYWLQIPIGGAAMDQSFPRAAKPRSRTYPARLKSFVGSSSTYEEGIDFVAKVAKLLVLNIGVNKPGEATPEGEFSAGTADLLRFLSFITPYLNPSNVGSWTFTLGAFLHYFSYEICHRFGVAGSLRVLQQSEPEVAKALSETEPGSAYAAIPPRELVALLDALLPLCQQALYSKNSHVGRAGEAAMVYLAQIDPINVTPSFLDFATRALDISAVNLAHQAPSALSALTRLVQPAVRRKPSILLGRLPQLLRLSLAGIDSNDQNKTLRTLILYRNLTSWIPFGSLQSPVGGNDGMETDESNGTDVLGSGISSYLDEMTQSKEYLSAIKELPETSLLLQKESIEDDDQMTDLLLGEAQSAMEDWMLGFLDRVYNLLRDAGEREKAGKTSSGVANRHSSSDVAQARNFSRILQECLLQLFAATDASAHKQAVRSVAQFLATETLPSASKDASFLCQAICSARVTTPTSGEATIESPGLATLVPILTEDLEQSSNKTRFYRIRCLAGAVRYAGKAVLHHREALKAAIALALGSDDKHVLKAGCKLLRHTLASQSDSYPILSSYRPQVGRNSNSWVLGSSASLQNAGVTWNIPDSDGVCFCHELFKLYVMTPICDLQNQTNNLQNDNLADIRRCLRIIRYALRGGSGILLDLDGDGTQTENTNPLDTSFVPHEKAVKNLLEDVPALVREELGVMRKQICSFAVSMTSIVGSETLESESVVGGASGPSSGMSSDAKVCKEVSEICLLLLTRRGSTFRCQEGKTIWKAQKQLVCDFVLSAEADHLASVKERSGLSNSAGFVLYKDGEDGGKSLPRRLLVKRVHLFYESIQRNSSFEIPRRLRKLQASNRIPSRKLYDPEISAVGALKQIDNVLNTSTFRSLDGYEGLVDGLFALACHPNTQVRSAGIGVVDYALTRFGWLVKSRVPRLLAAVTLNDDSMKGKHGIPSCSQLSKQTDAQGKKRRLAEVMKGVCSILGVPRTVREIIGSEESRLSFVKTMCETDKVISQLPTEEMQKMVHYFQSVFNPFRSKYYCLFRAKKQEKRLHEESIQYLMNLLSNDDADIKTGDARTATHWRRRLLVAWFITCFIDEEDLRLNSNDVGTKLWNLCFSLLENEVGQPLQRLALGLFGRLLSFSHASQDHGAALESLFVDNMTKDQFCSVLSQALVYDHREDSSVGGGHDAQWSTGVEELIRDAGRNVAPRALFPFTRTGQSSGVFKVTHAQLIEAALLRVGSRSGETANHLLKYATELAAAPPSEDQRNQQVTSAEIFAGVCRAQLQHESAPMAEASWQKLLLPFLEDVVPKFPIAMAGAFFDAIRYGIQFSATRYYFSLLSWICDNIENSMWKGEVDDSPANGKGSTVGSEGFTLQSKWLYLASAILVELDVRSANGSAWFAESVPRQKPTSHADRMGQSWDVVCNKLLPRLLSSVGHPYENCRDHIAGCLFRIYSCQKKIGRFDAGDSGSGEDAVASKIIARFLSISDASDVLVKEKYNSLLTVRKFFAYTIYLGDSKTEFSDLILPLLPLAFEALQTTTGEETSEGSESDDVAIRALEAEVCKGFRYTIAELSVSCILSYGKADHITRVLEAVKSAAKNRSWQVRQGAAHFLRCFEGCHKFLFSPDQSTMTRNIIASLLADERREVSAAAMSALTGILAATPLDTVESLVLKYSGIANRSRIKKKKKKNQSADTEDTLAEDELKTVLEKEKRRARNQQTSVFFLCAAILAQPYETPKHVPIAISAISKHSFEKSAPLGVRDIVKKCCGEYKRTHMSDNWDLHRKVFDQEQLEALEDVVSTPHYYA